MPSQAKPNRCPTCHRLHKRSHPQNALYWSLLHMIAERVKPEGAQYSAEVWHVYFKDKILGREEVTLPNGKTTTRESSTALLDVAEFSEYFEKVQAWAANRGVWLADLEAA